MPMRLRAVLPRPLLRSDQELRVLWLTRGNQELALSLDGIWLRARRRVDELVWDDIEQIQVVKAAGFRRGARVEIFGRDAKTYAVGPFPLVLAQRWVVACADAAGEHGQRPLPLDGAEGFALGRHGHSGRSTDPVQVDQD